MRRRATPSERGFGWARRCAGSRSCSHSHARAPRGQALAETALGLLAFVTVLLFGIHFAEVGFLSLKVQEAAHFAVWDATGRKQHDTFDPATEQPDWGLYQREAIAKAGQEAAARYADYDGRSSSPGAAAAVSQLLTRGEPIQTACAADATVPALSVDGLDPQNRLRAAYSGPAETGISCTSQAAIYGLRIPRHFLEERGGFKAEHWTPIQIQVCSSGRATGAQCQGKLSVLLDDWGFSGDREGAECPVLKGPDCANPGYYQMVRAVYQAAGGTGRAAGQLATWTAGGSPVPDENEFWMSFVGSDAEKREFQDDLGSSHGETRWETTPFSSGDGRYRESFEHRSPNCFLGGEGCR